jgi:hypothetical protein
MFYKTIFLHLVNFYNPWYCTLQVLQTLTDAAVPSKELISSIKNLFSKTKVAACFKKEQSSYQLFTRSELAWIFSVSEMSASSCRMLRSFLQSWLICQKMRFSPPFHYIRNTCNFGIFCSHLLPRVLLEK